MSILSLLAVPELLSDIVNVIGKHVSDPGVMGEIKAQMEGLTIPESLTQAKLEAQQEASPKDYLWATRATVEWVCIFGLIMAVVIAPIGVALGYEMPVIPLTVVLNLIYGLLGLGATRLAESFIKGGV